jgi:hypothetical protein
VTDRPDESDRRRFRRILFDAPLSVQLPGSSHDARLIDISLRGALIQRPDDWPADPGPEAELRIHLDSQGNDIRMRGQLTHQEGTRIGFLCIQIDMDSITHLKRLVELNLGDPDLLERELEGLG